jgi:hypothetical protein
LKLVDALVRAGDAEDPLGLGSWRRGKVIFEVWEGARWSRGEWEGVESVRRSVSGVTEARKREKEGCRLTCFLQPHPTLGNDDGNIARYEDLTVGTVTGSSAQRQRKRGEEKQRLTVLEPRWPPKRTADSAPTRLRTRAPCRHSPSLSLVQGASKGGKRRV